MGNLNRISDKLMELLLELNYTKAHQVVKDFQNKINLLDAETLGNIEKGFSIWISDLERTKQKLKFNGQYDEIPESSLLSAYQSYISSDEDMVEFLTNVVNQ